MLNQFIANNRQGNGRPGAPQPQKPPREIQAPPPPPPPPISATGTPRADEGGIGAQQQAGNAQYPNAKVGESGGVGQKQTRSQQSSPQKVTRLPARNASLISQSCSQPLSASDSLTSSPARYAQSSLPSDMSEPQLSHQQFAPLATPELSSSASFGTTGSLNGGAYTNPSSMNSSQLYSSTYSGTTVIAAAGYLSQTNQQQADTSPGNNAGSAQRPTSNGVNLSSQGSSSSDSGYQMTRDRDRDASTPHGSPVKQLIAKTASGSRLAMGEAVPTIPLDESLNAVLDGLNNMLPLPPPPARNPPPPPTFSNAGANGLARIPEATESSAGAAAGSGLAALAPGPDVSGLSSDSSTSALLPPAPFSTPERSELPASDHHSGILNNSYSASSHTQQSFFVCLLSPQPLHANISVIIFQMQSSDQFIQLRLIIALNTGILLQVL